MSQAAELARDLARHAEAVCRHYLPNGRRSGRYWLTGDVHDTPGRSLYVRLAGPLSGPGAAGHWTDSARAEFGDLLDLIAANCGLGSLRDACEEARKFLSLPSPASTKTDSPPPRRGSEAARRLFCAGVPILGTHAEAYLRARGITGDLRGPSLRFHPALWYRSDKNAPRQSWPGLLAAVTDSNGRITGVHRTFLDRERPHKAPLPDSRRALGYLLGNGVRFPARAPTSLESTPAPCRSTGQAPAHVLLAGEGIETVLSLKTIVPAMPMIAALSANHLAAINFTPMLARLYVACDRDAAGRIAAARLHARGAAAGIDVRDLVPVLGDFNEDLRQLGFSVLSAGLKHQLAPDEALLF